MSEHPKPLRVAIQQPVLPAYRIPVFQSLSQRPGIDLKIYYGDRSNSPPNVEQYAFGAEMVHLNEVKVAGHPVIWHKPQWQCASRKVCDVLIQTWDIHYLSLVPGLLRARAAGVRTVLWGHGYSKQESFWRSWPRSTVGKLGNVLLFYNQFIANRFIEDGWDPGRLFVAPNTIDQGPIQEARQHWLDHPEALAQFKKENQLDQGPVILFISRLAADRRVDLLVESMPKLAERFPGIQALIIGKGEEEQQRLEELAKARGVTNQFRFLGAIYGEEKLSPWMMSSDLFCFPANIGLSILHAFGYGLPVVTSNNVAKQGPEIVCLRNEENGLTYEHNNHDAMTEAISKILSDEELRNRLATEAHRTATEVYALEKMVDGLEAAIRASTR